ncbi:MAG: hypothetical protein M1819_001670 [Sarea resinae]|nr:MAG: hypothetical protein M1819_001670 [Sarea resinae]
MDHLNRNDAEGTTANQSSAFNRIESSRTASANAAETLQDTMPPLENCQASDSREPLGQDATERSGDGRSSTIGKGRKVGKGKRQRTRTTSTSVIERLACPFNRHDPILFSATDPFYRTCAGPGWEEMHRVKEHIVSKHLQCGRCWLDYQAWRKLHPRNDAQGLSFWLKNHPCHHHEIATDGIPLQKIEELGIGTRARPKPATTREEKWTELYEKLFPNEVVRSPFYEKGVLDQIMRLSETSLEHKSVDGDGLLSEASRTSYLGRAKRVMMGSLSEGKQTIDPAAPLQPVSRDPISIGRMETAPTSHTAMSGHETSIQGLGGNAYTNMEPVEQSQASTLSDNTVAGSYVWPLSVAADGNWAHEGILNENDGSMDEFLGWIAQNEQRVNEIINSD